MPQRVELLEQCSRCSAPSEVLESQLCPRCIRYLKADGWKIYSGGSRRKGRILVSPQGRVKVDVFTNQRTMSLLTGEIDVADLDEEELARGQCRNESGTFDKREPEMVPKSMHDRMMRELFARSDERLREGLLDAVHTMLEICNDPEVEPGVRVRTAQWIFERLRGKVPETIVFSQEKPYEVLLERVQRGPRPGKVARPSPPE